MPETKVGFSVQDNGVLSQLDRMKRSADDLGRGMIRDARAYSSAGKEVVSYIEQQIKAMERRNKLDEQSAKIQVESKYRAGSITQEERKSQLGKISLESDLDKQQVLLLRELIETTKQSARNEIIEDRKNVEKQITNDRTLNQLGLADDKDEKEALKRTLQRQFIGDVTDTEKSERGKFAARNVERGTNYLAGLAMSKNEIYALAAAAAAIPIVGQAASMLLGKALSSAESYQAARGSVTSIAGSASYQGFEMSQYGYTASSVLSATPGVLKARGFSAGYGNDVRDMLLLERGMAIERGNTMSILQMSRSDTSGRSARYQVQSLQRGLTSIGAVKEGDTALTNEYLQILTQTGTKQVELLGRVDTGMNQKMLLQIANLNDTFKNPAVLRGVYGSIESGLSTAATPQLEAMQFAALSRTNPKGSLLELEMMRENPFSNPEYLRNMIEMLKSASVDEDSFVRNIKGTFGTSLTISKELARGFNTTGLADVDIEKIKEIDLESRASSSTGLLAKATAKTDNIFAAAGDIMAEKMAKMIEKFEEYLGKLDSELKIGSDTSKEVAKMNKETADSFYEAMTLFRKGTISFEEYAKRISSRPNPYLPAG